MLTLPKEWVKKMGWQAKQVVELSLQSDGITITDVKKEDASDQNSSPMQSLIA